jgi:hypothetical protein
MQLKFNYTIGYLLWWGQRFFPPVFLTTVLTESISMDLPLGQKKGRGRPAKAVSGSLNKQPEVNQNVESKCVRTKKVLGAKYHHIDLASEKGKVLATKQHALLYLSIFSILNLS